MSYDPTYHDRLIAVEERHFWFRARNCVINTVVAQIVAKRSPGIGFWRLVAGLVMC